MSAIQARHARNELVMQYLPMVRRIVGRIYRDIPGGIGREDLVHVGVIGLIEAIDRFDAGRGVAFESFAKHRVRGAILDYMRSTTWAPRGSRRRSRELSAAHEHLAAELGRAPSTAELAEVLGVTVDRVDRTRREDERRTVLSLSAPLTIDGFSLEDVVAGEDDPEANAAHNDLAERVRAACEDLPVVEADAIRLRYLADLKLREVGAELGVSESRVCQLCKAGIERLRREVVDQRLAA